MRWSSACGTATALFRILQEALTNVARHVRASAVDVHLTRADDWIDLIVEDDGVGLPAGWSEKPSFGLMGMRERAELLGGHFEVTSEPGRGTRIHARVPTATREDEP